MSRKKTINDFIIESKLLYDNKYDYSKVSYINNTTKICIICSIHGEFYQTPKHFLHGHACQKCGYIKTFIKLKKGESHFLNEVTEKYGDKFAYDNVKYINNKNKINVTCKKCNNSFDVEALSHLKNGKCPFCSKRKHYTTEEWVSMVKQIYDENLYGYSDVEYIDNKTPVIITCVKHGAYKIRPDNFIHNGGCPKCHAFKMENEVEMFLIKNNIRFEFQKKYTWLRCKNPMSLDFYLPEYQIAIECQGEQHFKPIKYWGGEPTFNTIVNRDKLKIELCKNNGIKILYYCDIKKYEVNENVFYKLEELKKYL